MRLRTNGLLQDPFQTKITQHIHPTGKPRPKRVSGNRTAILVFYRAA